PLPEPAAALAAIRTSEELPVCALSVRRPGSGQRPAPPGLHCSALALLASQPQVAHELVLELGPRRSELGGCGGGALVPSAAVLPWETRRSMALGLLADSNDEQARHLVLRLARRSSSDLSEAAMERLGASARLDPEALAFLRAVLIKGSRKEMER